MIATLRRIRSFTNLSNAEQLLVVEAFAALGAADVVLRVAPLRRLAWRKLVDTRPLPSRVPSGEDFTQIAQYAGWLETASRRHVIAARCLHRSIALLFWLRRRGIVGELKIGVRRQGAELAAHAWVELCGENVSDAAAGDPDAFAVLAGPAREPMKLSLRSLAAGDSI